MPEGAQSRFWDVNLERAMQEETFTLDLINGVIGGKSIAVNTLRLVRDVLPDFLSAIFGSKIRCSSLPLQPSAQHTRKSKSGIENDPKVPRRTGKIDKTRAKPFRGLHP